MRHISHYLPAFVIGFTSGVAAVTVAKSIATKRVNIGAPVVRLLFRSQVPRIDTIS